MPDKLRDQASNNSNARDIPFSNHTMEDNQPDHDPWANNGANDDRGSEMGDRNAKRADGDAGSTTFRTEKPPKDPHAPPGYDAHSNYDSSSIVDQGLNETKEVGWNGSVAQYGLKK
jgi:hypothetical protein